MGNTANKQMICEVLMEAVKQIKISWRCAAIPEEADLSHRLLKTTRSSSWRPGSQNRIWSVLPQVLQNAGKKHMRSLPRVFSHEKL